MRRFRRLIDGLEFACEPVMKGGTVKHEWPVTIERLSGGRATSLVTVWAPANASRATLNELAVKRARELGHATAEPFYSAEPVVT